MASFYEASPRISTDSQIQRQHQPVVQEQREPHALTLKVLRAARPTFTQSHDYVRDVKLPGKPDAGEPSTSNFTLTPLLALPTAFGAINLGETFRGLVVAANDSNYEVVNPMLRIEMLTANMRMLLWEAPVSDPKRPRTLKPGESLEAPMLEYEIKEPGQHSLSCSVSYQIPDPNAFLNPEAPQELISRGFRKLYKFQASNPLSVKTKVHTSKNIAAPVDETAQDTVFLEVQVQNVSAEPLFFEQLRFEPSEHIALEDLAPLQTAPTKPGDVIQCLYILNPEQEHRQAIIDRAKANGGNMVLGKLDIRWRSRMGDTGHLATSQLVRKLPPPPQLPISSSASPRPKAAQAYLSQAAISPQNTPTRSNFAGMMDHRAQHAPSPLHSPRLTTETSFSGLPSLPPFASPFDAQNRSQSNLTASLHVKPLGSRSVSVGSCFKVQVDLKLVSFSAEKRKRRLRLAVQHVDYHSQQRSQATEIPHRFITQDFDTPTAIARQSFDSQAGDRSHQKQSFDLPPPVPLHPSHPFFVLPLSGDRAVPSRDMQFMGLSLRELEPVIIDHTSEGNSARPLAEKKTEEPEVNPLRLSTSSTATDDVSLSEIMRKQAVSKQRLFSVPITLEYFAMSPGIHAIGGLRVLVLEDTWTEDAGDQGGLDEGRTGLSPCSILETAVIAEVVVESQ